MRARTPKPPPIEPFNRFELDELASGSCPCCNEKYSAEKHYAFAPKCHDAPLLVEYWDGILTVRCAECGKFVAAVRVGKDLV